MPPEHSGQNEPSRDKPERPSDKNKSTIEARLAALTHTYHDEQESNREQTDRQDRGKKWREIWTLVFVVLTTGGVFYQGWVLHQSDRTFKDTLAAQQISSQRQLRAYLHVSHGSLNPSDVSPSIPIAINHAGVTPAYKIRLDAKIEVIRYLVGELNLSDPSSGNVSPVFQRAYSILFGQTLHETIVPDGPFAEAMRLVNSTDPLIGDHRIYLHGVVRYLDIFGIENPSLERRYEFCFVFHPVRGPGGSERGCEKYNKPG